MKVSDFLAVTGSTLHALALGARVSYPVLHKHIRKGAPLTLAVARKLEAFDARMNAAELLGLAPATTPDPPLHAISEADADFLVEMIRKQGSPNVAKALGCEEDAARRAALREPLKPSTSRQISLTVERLRSAS